MSAAFGLPETPLSSEPGFSEMLAALFPPQGQTAAPPADEASGNGLMVPAIRRRRKLWEISASCHCVVIGACLSMAELRRLARHAGVEQWNGESDYDLHHAAARLTCERNVLSTLIQKELERRFAPAVRRFARARTDDEIRALWKEALSRGEVAGALWAVMTHAMASERTLCLVYEDLHMLSHQAGASNRADLRRLAELERENETLREQLKRHSIRSAEQIADKDALIAALGQRVADAAGVELRLQEAERRLRALDDDEALAQARRLLAAESLRAQRAQERADRLAGTEARCTQLEHALAEARHECEAADRALRGILAQLSCGGEVAACAACVAHLSGRCVLYVGGRTGLVDQYRLLVEQCHGRFMHHDGGLEHNLKRLQALLASADGVVCAAGNVSHGAYHAVKRFCKQHGKPCVLLKNASLSSFVNGIRTLAGEAFQAGMGDTVLVTES